MQIYKKFNVNLKIGPRITSSFFVVVILTKIRVRFDLYDPHKIGS